ncbi:MBG domain-containing protein, partial [Polaribacter marinaquae]
MNLFKSKYFYKRFKVAIVVFISLVNVNDLYAQTQVSFSNWVKRGASANGDWEYDSANEKLTQKINGSPTFYVSNDNYINKSVEGRFKVATTGDDDFAGFVLGFESAVDDSGTENKFLLIDWKQGNQTVSPEGTANAEIRLSYFDTTQNENTIFWETQTANSTWGNIAVYEPSASFSGVNSSGGWVDNFTYKFKTVYTESNVKIYFDFGDGVFTKVFDIEATAVSFFDSFPEGKFGFYNYSQDDVIYDNFTVPNGNLSIVSSGGGTENVDWQKTGSTIIPLSGDAKINASEIEAFANSSDLAIVCDGDISVESDIRITGSNDITLKSKGNIQIQDNTSIETNGGDLILWSNSDNSDGGYVLTGQNVTLDTRQGAASTGGGDIHIGGGADTNSDGFPDDPTAGKSHSGGAYGILFGNAAGSGVEILSGGGNITLIGGIDANFTASENAHGIGFYPGYTVNAGAGSISFTGYANSGGANSFGIDLMTFGATNSSSISTTGDLTLNGVTTVINNTNHGIIINTGLTINAGTVNITGDSDDAGLVLNGAVVSDGAIELKANSYSFSSGSISGQGALTIEPLTNSNSFSSAFSNSSLTLGSALTGLTIGKPSNTANVTIGSSTAITGPISIYGGDININNNLNTTGGGAAGDILLKASSDIVLAESKSLTTNGGNVILWSNTDNETTSGSVVTRKGSSITTNSGHLWIGGGTESASQWNGLTVGDGYAVAGTSLNDLDRPNTNTDASWRGAGIFLDGTTISTSGGHIVMYGKSVGNYDGLVTYGINTINSGTGKISINADANDNYASLFGVHNSVTPSITNITSTNSDADAITFNLGSGTGTQNYGAWVEGDVIVLASNGGGITYNALSNVSNVGLNLGYSTTSSGYLYLLADVGDINLNTGLGGITLQNQFTDIYLGKNADKGVSSSSSDITFTSDKISSNGILHFSTSGAITVESLGNSFTSAFDTSTLDYSSDVTGLTIGKATNNQDVTIGAVAIDGPLTVYGNNILVSGAVNVGNNTVKLSGSGNVTDGVNGYIIAESLALLDGNVTLNNTSNNVATIAGGDNTTKLGGLNYVDASGGLEIGSVNPDGIYSSGLIEIATLSGDLEVTQPIVSTLATGDAVKLYADKDEEAENAGDGNIKITDNGSITVESGARALLYSGKESESTGVQTEVGGESNTRTSVDASTDLSTVDPALSATGKYGLFRVDNTIDIATLTVEAIADQTYTGSAIEPTVVVKNGATTLVEDTDYTLSYTNNINVGTATVTVTGKGNYNGTKDVTFAITPAPLTITAEDKSKVFGEVDPELTVSYAGFVNGED